MCPAWGKQPKPPQTGFGVGTGGSVPPRGELSKVSQTHGADSTKKKTGLHTGFVRLSALLWAPLCFFFRRSRERKTHSAAHPAARLQPASPLPAQERARQIFGWRKSLLARTGVFASLDAFPQALLSLLSPFHANCCDGARSTQAAAGAEPQQHGEVAHASHGPAPGKALHGQGRCSASVLKHILHLVPYQQAQTGK